MEPPKLYWRMLHTIIWRRDENFQKSSFDRSVRKKAFWAEKILADNKVMLKKQ